MAFFFTEDQMVEAAKKAYREQNQLDRQLLAVERQRGPVSLSVWTDPDTELDQLGEALKDALAQVRPTRPILSVVGG